MATSNKPTFPAIAPKRGSIIVVEDNHSLSEEVCLVLEDAGWSVCGVADAEAFRALLPRQIPDMVVLDLNLPGEDGISLCKCLRLNYPQIGIVMLTARVMGRERTEGYVAGADVYLTKPTRPEELLAVVHNLSNRRSLVYPGTPDTEYWTLQLKGARLVSPQSDILSLTPSECIFLRELALSPDACSYRQLNDMLYDELGGEANADKSHKPRIEVLVSRLRTKLSQFGGQALEIKTVHGVGYQLTSALKLQSDSQHERSTSIN
jgi:DNA-binding response OmpR family regulator